MTSHILYSGCGIYAPRICPKVVLWQRIPPGDPDPVFGVYVPNKENAATFAQVAVVMDGQVILQIPQVEGI